MSVWSWLKLTGCLWLLRKAVSFSHDQTLIAAAPG